MSKNFLGHARDEQELDRRERLLDRKRESIKKAEYAKSEQWRQHMRQLSQALQAV